MEKCREFSIYLHRFMETGEYYEIISDGEHYTPSEYQRDILEFVQKGAGNLVVNAVAGSSKTTTIVSAIRYIPVCKKVLYVAFNRDIAQKIREIVPTFMDVTVYTYHSLGLHILQENGVVPSVGDEFLDQYKYTKHIKMSMPELKDSIAQLLSKKKQVAYIANLKKLVDYARYYMASSDYMIHKIANMYGLTLLADEVRACAKVMAWGKTHTETIDYTDMIWLPNELNCVCKKNRFDMIFIDEAQDTSVSEQQLVKRCTKRGSRIIAVGDRNQQINVWCGASTDAMTELEKELKAKVLPLPVSYRCPLNVVNYAKKYCDCDMQSGSMYVGEVTFGMNENDPKPGDMVLCRNTAPLVGLMTRLLKKNKNCFIRGGEAIKENLIHLVEESKADIIDRQCLTFDGLFPFLYNKIHAKIKDLCIREGLEVEEAIEHQAVQEMLDTLQCLSVLSEGVVKTEALANRIMDTFKGDMSDAIQLSTVHKAKGLEADNVYILMPSLMPSKYAKLDWEKANERNIQYVAFTRAKKTLNFIEESPEDKKKLNTTPADIKRELDMIISSIEKNKEFGVSGNIESKKTGKEDVRPVTSVKAPTKKKKAIDRFKDIM